MKISDIFYINQGHQITDEEIYFASGNIPILTANNEIKGYGKSQIVNRSDLPCLTYPSKAFSGKIYVQSELFDANNTTVLIPKEKYRPEMNLHYFASILGNIFLTYLSSESQVSYLGKASLSNIEIDYPFPSIKKQDDFVKHFEKMNKLEGLITNEIEKIEKIISYELELEKFITLTMSEIAILNKGSNKISEEMIYKNYDSKGIPVYSSATENDGLMGMVSSKCYDEFHKQGSAKELTWTTNGYAGKVFYRNTDYLYSEKCGRIVIRQQYQNKILPQYLCYILNQITYKYKTSESNNGKLDIIHMENIPVKIPIKSNSEIDVSLQIKIINAYNKLEEYKQKLFKIKAKLNNN